MFCKKALALSVGLLIASPLTASAADFESLLRNYLGSGGNNNVAANQNLIKSNISTRQAQLESQISSGVIAGQLTPAEERDLRAELNRIEGLEGSYLVDGNLTNIEVQHLVDELTNLTTRLQTYLTNTTTVQVGSNRHGDWFRRNGGPNAGPGNQAQRQAHLDTQQAQIDARIEQGVTSGRLSNRESSSLRAALNQIAADEQAALADGRLSYDEQQRLLASLNTLDTRVTTELRDAERRGRNRGPRGGRAGGGINAQQSLLRQRIQGGIRSGKLTRSEADQLMAKERRIADLEVRLRTTGGGLSFEESRRLNMELSQLSRDVSKQLADRDVW